MSWVEVSDGELWYEWVGSTGPLVTLLNGHTRSSTDFKAMARLLNEHGYQVLLVDNRGSGRTKYHKTFSLQDFVDDVITLWKHLEVEKSTLLGISMGGIIGQVLASQHPEMLDKLILVSTAGDFKWFNPRPGAWSIEPEEVQQKLELFFSEGFLQRNPNYIEMMVKQTIKAIETGSFKERAEHQKKALAEFPGLEVAQSISVPTFVIHGGLDRAISVDAARELAEVIPHARLIVIADAGHLLLAEAPKIFYEKVLDILKAK